MKSLELFNLSGRNALVTGGGRGLGKVMASALAEAGAKPIHYALIFEVDELTADSVPY